MNELPLQPRVRPTTQAAEGVPRLRWTLAEFDRLTELGIFTEDDRIELIGGELVPMSPKGNRHENVRTKLLNALARKLSDGLEMGIELGWRPNDDTYIEPDILISKTTPDPGRVSPSEVLLAIEIAVSSLAYDTGRKSQVYAALGVSEYWVIDATTLAARIHREPSAEGYRGIVEATRGEILAPDLVAAVAVNLADLGLD